MDDRPIKDGFELRQIRSSLPISLLRTREMVMERFRPMLAKHGLTEQQWRVLRVLHEEGDLDAGTVADRACILAASLSRISRTLETAGLIANQTG